MRLRKPKSLLLSRRSKVPSGPSIEAQTWPVWRAWGPWRDCWEATACGSVMIVRESPDGRFAAAASNISLITGGLNIVLSRACDSRDDLDEFLEQVEGILGPRE